MRRTVGAILCALSLLCGQALASERAEVQIYDPAGNALANVDIAVVGRGGAVRTNAQGQATLLGLPKPPFELLVFDSRGTWLGVIKVTSSEALSKPLTLEPRLKETITVVPSTAPDTSVPPASAATVWSDADRAETAPSQLIDVVQSQPGATRVGNGAAAVPALRGLARGRTLILLDGARVVSERRAGPSATFLDPFALERVEIVRGLGSVAYGSDAMGGVIHAITARPQRGVTGGRYEATLGFGQNKGGAAVEWNQALGNSNGALLFQAQARRSSDWESPQGSVEDSSAESRGWLLRGEHTLGSTDFWWGVQRNEAIDVGKPANNSDIRQTIYPTENSTRISLGALLPSALGFEKIEALGVFGRYRLVTDRTELTDDPRTRERADVDAKDLQLRLDAERAIPNGVFRTGIDVSSRFDLTADNIFFEESSEGVFEVVGTTAAIEDAQRLLAGVYTEAEGDLPGGRHGWAGGLRVDRVRTENSGGGAGERSTSDTGISGYAAWRTRFTDNWEGALRLGKGFRDPGLSDRYFAGVTGRGLIVGEPTLIAEESLQWDLSVRGSVGSKSRLGIFAYHYTIDHLVERFEQPMMPDVFGFRNRGDSTLKGLELEWDFIFNPKYALRVIANAAEGTLDSGAPADDVPAEQIAAVLRHSASWGWWRFGALGSFQDHSPGPNEIVTPGYVELHAAMGWKVKDIGEIRVRVDNLLDRAYPESADDRTTLAPGRRITVTWAGNFGL